jgi:hypothetical protein
MKKSNNKMKLCAVGQANTHKIYRYFFRNMPIKKRLEDTANVLKEFTP